MSAVGILFTFIVLASCQYDPQKFKPFLMQNRMPQCQTPGQPRLPRSYYVPPKYFDQIPLNQRVPPGANPQPTMVPSCEHKVIQVPALDAYTFQTERFITTMGLNIYDGALWTIAMAVLGEVGLAEEYENGIFAPSKTCQFQSLRGDAPCKGVILEGQCTDPEESGVCGFCYGAPNRTMAKDNAWTFRSISDYWGLEGTVDARCPELNHQWTWNDYKPILGENSWANLMGPLQVAYRKYGNNPKAIPDNDVSLRLALAFLPSLDAQYIPSLGAVAFAPKNTLASPKRDFGFDVSLENNISLLGGLKMLRYILQQKGTFNQFLPQINKIIAGIETFSRSAYDANLGYFRQGGTFNLDGSFVWASDGPTSFAVDCQTWTISQLGYNWTNVNLGAGTLEKIWNKTKELGGYHYVRGTGAVDGFGFAKNADEQAFSGEWTFGAINMLRILAAETGNSQWKAEGEEYRKQIETRLTSESTIDGVKTLAVQYCNKRYYIPFGWFVR